MHSALAVECSLASPESSGLGSSRLRLRLVLGVLGKSFQPLASAGTAAQLPGIGAARCVAASTYLGGLAWLDQSTATGGWGLTQFQGCSFWFRWLPLSILAACPEAAQAGRVFFRQSQESPPASPCMGHLVTRTSKLH